MDENPYNLPPMRPSRFAFLTTVLESAYTATWKENYVNSSLTKQHILALAAADETATKRFTPYLANLYVHTPQDERMRLVNEDLPKATAYLWAFDKLQAGRLPLSLEKKDGNGTVTGVKTLPELYRTIRPWLTRLRTQELPDSVEPILGREIRGEPSTEAAQYASTIIDPEEIALLTGKDPAATLIAHTDDYKLVRINHVAAARFYGRETQWCTAAADSHSAFDDYNKTGSLFVLLLPKTKEKFQMHFGSNTSQVKFCFADAADQMKRPNEIAKLSHFNDFYPIIMDAVLDDAEARCRVPNIDLKMPLTTTQDQRLFSLAADLSDSATPTVRAATVPVLADKFGTDGPAGQIALQTILKLSNDSDEQVIRNVVQHATVLPAVTGNITAQNVAVMALENIAKSPHAQNRRKVAESIIHFPAFVPQHYLRLLKMARELAYDTDGHLADIARKRLKKVGSKFILPGLFDETAASLPSYPQPHLAVRTTGVRFG